MGSFTSGAIGRSLFSSVTTNVLGFSSAVAVASVWWPAGALAAWDFRSQRYMQDGKGVPIGDALSFSRATVAYGDDELGEWALYDVDVPRLTQKGLYVEGAETNIVPAPYDLSGWVDVSLSPASTPLGSTLQGIFTGAYVLTSNGGSSSRRRQNTTINFVSGTPYYFRCRVKAGSVPSGRFFWQCEAVSPAAGSCAVSGLIGALSNSVTASGTCTNILTTLDNGGYEITFVFTPNFSGTGRVSLGPGSSTSGQNIIAIGMQGGLTPAGSPILGLATRAADAATLKRTGDYDLRLTFDNGEEQWLTDQTGDFAITPANLDRSRIASAAAFPAGQSLLYGLADIPISERVA